jgi:hypothetical protein
MLPLAQGQKESAAKFVPGPLAPSLILSSIKLQSHFTFHRRRHFDRVSGLLPLPDTKMVSKQKLYIMSEQLNDQQDLKLPLEETGLDGIGTGLEAEQVTEIPSLPFDPDKIDVITVPRTIDLLLTRLKEGELDLSPDFQRRSNLWNETTKSALIESLLLRIPIPSLYVSEDHKGNYTVVDGLQRICAIAHFVNVAALNKAVGAKLNPLRLGALLSLKEYNERTFDELSRPMRRRINETELTLHVIRANTPPAVKFNIFSRINRGGLPLTAQEIRNAIYPGEWRNKIHELTKSQSFKEATSGKIKGERMEDLELVLRFVALYSLPRESQRPPDQNLDSFLNEFVEQRCSDWTSAQWDDVSSAFHRAMTYAPKVFKNIAFRKYSPPGKYRSPINRGLFETESVALARRSETELDQLSERADLVLQVYGRVFETDEGFKEALLYATGRGIASNKRLQVMESIMAEALK